MNARDLLEKIVGQIDLDYVLDPDSVSQELWDLKVEAKILLQNDPAEKPNGNTRQRKKAGI